MSLSTGSSDISQASTKINGGDARPSPSNELQPQLPPEKSSAPGTLQHVAESASARDIFLFLIAFRILNALSVKTFFQPDEYFQSLEPAWRMVFGDTSGAWITWEWRHQLRSAIHPAIFAGVYHVSSLLADLFKISPLTRADLLIESPKVVQGVFAAVGDFYTWKLAERIHGRGSVEAWGALVLTVVSPWQWFCSTRTLSNCLETTLTVVALYLWPWQWSLTPKDDDAKDEDGLRTSNLERGDGDEEEQLVRCLLLAAIACVLRPTNVLIWLCLVVFTVWQPSQGGRLQLRIPWTTQQMIVPFSGLSFLATRRERIALFRQSMLCGFVILALSTCIDRLYYQTWTFPPLRFLYFNLAQSLAVFYGRNDWHYYLTQGYPLLLTSALPFALIGIHQSLCPPQSPDPPPSRQFTLSRTIKCQLAITCILVPLILSLISHKEVRFIYPLLPALHILASRPITTFFSPTLFPPSTSNRTLLTASHRKLRTGLLYFLLSVNLIIAFYMTQIHVSGPLTSLSYLRAQHVKHYVPTLPGLSNVHQAGGPESSASSSLLLSDPIPSEMTVGFLMPCHSTPWRSHLIFPSIDAWALSCEPPINLNQSARSTYMDEADLFYENPASFLRRTMPRPPRRGSSLKQMRFGSQLRSQYGLGGTGGSIHHDTSSSNKKKKQNIGKDGDQKRREWPDYLLFFSQLEPTLSHLLKGSGYSECHRVFNSHVHDDWRRRGEIVIYCVQPEEIEKARPGVEARERQRELKQGRVLEKARRRKAEEKERDAREVANRKEQKLRDVARKAESGGRTSTTGGRAAIGSERPGGFWTWMMGGGSSERRSKSGSHSRYWKDNLWA